MKIRTAFAIAFLGLSALACGGGGAASTDLSAYSVPLTDPWTGMSLLTIDSITPWQILLARRDGTQQRTA